MTVVLGLRSHAKLDIYLLHFVCFVQDANSLTMIVFVCVTLCLFRFLMKAIFSQMG